MRLPSRALALTAVLLLAAATVVGSSHSHASPLWPARTCALCVWGADPQGEPPAERDPIPLPPAALLAPPADEPAGAAAVPQRPACRAPPRQPA